MKKLILQFATVISALALGFAASAQVSSIQKDDVAPRRPLLEDMDPYLAFGFGYMDENEDLRTEGMPVNFKFVGSYILRDSWMVDGGLGLLIQNFNNRDSAEAAYTGTIDINPRYMFQ
ncbi:MAG: hypothetical protein AAF202_09280, partial [Pseudomonadota bacterium]